MEGLNFVALMGEVCAEPYFSESQSNGVTKLTFTLVTKRPGKGSVHSEQHIIVAYDKVADSLRGRLNDGATVFVEGRLQTTQRATYVSVAVLAHKVFIINDKNTAAAKQSVFGLSNV